MATKRRSSPPRPEEGIWKGEERYRLLSEAALENIAIIDRGTIVDVNDAFVKTSGYDRSEIIGQPAVKFAAPESREAIINNIISGSEEPYDAVGLKKDGTTFPVEITGRQISFKGRKVRVTVLRDITKRKRTEEALRVSEENLRAFAANANDGILIAVEGGKFVFANKRAAEIIGYSVDELLNLTFRDLAPPKELARLLGNLSRRLQGKSAPRQYESVLRRKDGVIVPVEMTASRTIWKGQPAAPAIFRDISERKCAEEMLRESEEKYRVLVEQAKDAVFIIQDGKYVFVNRATMEMTGYSEEELLSMHFLDLVALEARDSIGRRYKRRMQGVQEPPVSEAKIICKNGMTKHAEATAIHIQYKGKPAVLGVVRDISERKHAEELLKESENKYRTLVEQSLQGMIIAQGIPPRIVFTNPALAEMLGYGVEELLSLSPEGIRGLVHPGDQKMFFQRYGDRLAGKDAPPHYEFRAVRKDGQMLWAEMHSTRITYQGKAAVQAVFIDRTDHRAAEEALRESEQRYREIASSTPGVVYQSVMHKDGSISLLFLGDGVKDLVGEEPNEIMDDLSKMFEYVIPEDRDRLRRITDESKNSSDPMEFELRLKSKTGEIKWLRVVSKAHLLPDGNIMRNGVAYDITEHKWVEEQIRRYSKELEEKVKERTEQIRELERRHADSEKLAATGRMAARIAHEINNPLAGIKNSFLLIKDAISPGHPYYKYVGIIENEINRMARVVHRTFDLYRPDQEAVRTFSVSAVIWDIIALLEPSANKKHIEFAVGLPKTPLTVSLQEGYLTQILFNIINNAIEASPKKETIKIKAAFIDHVLTLTVADRGPGIPEEIRSQIFEPFFTTKSQETTGGLGLGLSVSKSMVDAMGGTVDFDTKVGKGTTFRIQIPIIELAKG
jgi:PAS domain S-box-containing protein